MNIRQFNKVIIKTGYSCNNNCLFCRVDEFRKDYPLIPQKRIIEKIALAGKKGFDFIIFSGGEPTIRKDIIDLLIFAGKKGMRTGLITNLRRLSYRAFASELFKTGIAYIHTSLHGSTPDIHDFLVQDKAFDEVVHALSNIREMRKAFSGSFELHVNTVINKKNMSDLERIIDLLSAFLPLNHKFSMMEPRGKFLFNRDSLLIPPASAAETAIKSLDYGHLKFGSRGMTFGLEGFPLCQICGSEKYIDNLFTHNILLMSEAYEDDFFPVDHGERVFSPVCDRCKSKKNCPGIYKEYFEIFKGRDLTPNL